MFQKCCVIYFKYSGRQSYLKYSSGLGYFKYLITYVSNVRKVYFINSIEHMLWKYSRGIFVQPFRKNCFSNTRLLGHMIQIFEWKYDSNIRADIDISNIQLNNCFANGHIREDCFEYSSDICSKYSPAKLGG